MLTGGKFAQASLSAEWGCARWLCVLPLPRAELKAAAKIRIEMRIDRMTEAPCEDRLPILR